MKLFFGKYEKSNFEKITVTNPTGENRLLNTKVLNQYLSGTEEDRSKISQEDLAKFTWYSCIIRSKVFEFIDCQ